MLEHRQAAKLPVVDEEPAHVAPEETDQRAMRVGLFVRMLVVQPMDGDPAGGRFLEAANAEQRQGMLQPARTGEAAVRQQAVVTEIDAQGAEDEIGRASSRERV